MTETVTFCFIWIERAGHTSHKIIGDKQTVKGSCFLIQARTSILHPSQSIHYCWRKFPSPWTTNAYAIRATTSASDGCDGASFHGIETSICFGRELLLMTLFFLMTSMKGCLLITPPSTCMHVLEGTTVDVFGNCFCCLLCEVLHAHSSALLVLLITTIKRLLWSIWIFNEENNVIESPSFYGKLFARPFHLREYIPEKIFKRI